MDACFEKTLKKITRLGKTQVWNIRVVEKGGSGFPEVWVEHGLDDGKKQTTYDLVDSGVNIGKRNETSALQQAIFMAERKIVKQKEEGYAETLNEAENIFNNSIDIGAGLPKELCFYKPKNSIDEKKLALLAEGNKLLLTVKRDGMMHIVKKAQNIEIYSRRVDLVTDKYPHLVEALEKIPENTILLGEILSIKDGKDDFNLVSSICRSDPEKAIQKQKDFGRVCYYIFDIAFENNKNLLLTKSITQRLERVRIITDSCNSEYILPAEIIISDPWSALEKIKERKLEGLVIWDKDKTMKDKECFTFNGKAYRPNVVWKLKPKYEDDFIVRFDPENKIGSLGKGKNKNKLGNVCVYQLDEQENEIFLGHCGGGLSDAQREFYMSASFPRVWCIEYDSVQPNTGALRFPVFKSDRTLVEDKYINECRLSDSILAARNIKTKGEESDE